MYTEKKNFAFLMWQLLGREPLMKSKTEKNGMIISIPYYE